VGLSIEAPDEHILILNEAREWVLPKIILVPSVDNMPLLTRVEVKIAGKPSAVAERLQMSYSPFVPKEPRKVGMRVTFGQQTLDSQFPIPSEVECDLIVNLKYYDSTRDGVAIKSKEHAVSKTCKIRAGAVERKRACEVQVQPSELLMTVGGGETTSLTIVVSNPEPGATLCVMLANPETVTAAGVKALEDYPELLNELRERLTDSLGATPRTARGSDGDKAAYRVEIALPLSEPSLRALEEVTRIEPLMIGIKASVNEASATALLKLETRKHQFPGWLAFDFGTTNSTVTVYDVQALPRIDGLPGIQESWLRARLGAWFQKSASEALRGGKRFNELWQSYLDQVSAGLGCEKADLPAALGGDRGKRLYEALRQLELTLRGFGEEEFRQAVWLYLADLYHGAFRVPPLRALNFYPVPLDRTLGSGLAAATLRSEMELSADADLTARPLNVLMGDRVSQNRLTAIVEAANADEMRAALSRFFQSPKRYFGTDKTFNPQLQTQRQKISAEDLMQAGWSHLKRLTEEARETPLDSDGEKITLNDGPFRRAVVTYPTVAPPSVRTDISRLVSDLGFDLVQTDFDEAVSAAVFYLMREFGGALDIGLESLRSRCRPLSNGRYYMNVLVFDIGGGTTDLALIQLVVSEIDPFDSAEDRGAGGRYYIIKPELLGSSGNMQLGGELITLRVFRLLKCALADQLATLVRQGQLTSTVLQSALTQIRERFRDNGGYISGSILECIDLDDPEQYAESMVAALDAAETILPTRWANDPKRFQTFYTLWEFAEKAKLAVGSRPDDGQSRPIYFRLSAEEVEQLLAQANLAVSAVDSERDLALTLTLTQIENAMRPVIRKAVGIAKGLLANKLGIAKPAVATAGSIEGGARPPTQEKVDWLILSGKSCQLALVDDEIRRTFQDTRETPYFVWNPERVTFDKTYAKLATSIGACYAEYLRQFRFAPKGALPALRQGYNQLYFDVKNLVTFLPCSFKMTKAGMKMQVLFESGSKLYQIDQEPFAKKRTAEFESLALQCEVYREDYEAATLPSWGWFNGEHLAQSIGMTSEDWIEHVRGQFEVDHRLHIVVLFCRGNPHFVVPDTLRSLNVRDALAKQARPATADITPPAVRSELFGPDGRLVWEIFVGDPTNRSKRTVLFEAGSRADRTFRPSNDNGPSDEKLTLGLISPALIDSEAFTEVNPSLPLYAQCEGENEWIPLGSLGRADDRPVYQRYYRVSLDRTGLVRIHPGEVSYWETTDQSVLRQTDGCVYRRPLSPLKRDSGSADDPFSGHH
jgi:hypothetical protein